MVDRLDSMKKQGVDIDLLVGFALTAGLIGLLLIGPVGFTGFAAFQPRGFQGLPYSDTDPTTSGADNSPGAVGAVISNTTNDSDSNSLGQPLSRENLTVRINVSNIDPDGLMQANFTLGSSIGSEKGSKVNGTNSTDTIVADIDVWAIAEFDRNVYYDIGSSINATIYVQASKNRGGDDLGYQYAFGFFNGTWNFDAFSACRGFDVTTENSWREAENTSKLINANVSAGWIKENVTFYGLNISVSTDELTCGTPGPPGMTNTSAKNKTVFYRWKWMFSDENGATFVNGTNLSQVGFNFTIIRNETKTFRVEDHRGEPSGAVDLYALFVEVNGSDANYGDSDFFSLLLNGSQSNLNRTQVAFSSINTTYFPSTESSNATLWFTGELGYAYGADAFEFNGTGHPVNISLWNVSSSGHQLVQIKSPPLNETGFFKVNFTLPERAQAGTWQIRTNFNSSDDAFPEARSTFRVMAVANETRIYGWFGENVSQFPVLTNITNRNGEIRIETYFYNNPQNFDVACNVTITNKTGLDGMAYNSTGRFCLLNTTAPDATGQQRAHTNFSINGSAGSSEDGFSSEDALINVSDVLRVNETNASANRVVIRAVNLGENVTHWGRVYNVRFEPLMGRTVQIQMINETNVPQNTNISVILDGNGFFNKTIFVAFTNSSNHSADGEFYRTRANHNKSNGTSNESTFGVSSLLNVTNTSSTFEVYNLGESTRHEGTIVSVDGRRLLNGRSVTVVLKTPDGAFIFSQNSTTNISGIFFANLTLNSTHPSDHTLNGTPYIYDLNATDGNFYNRTIAVDDSIFNVSSLLNITNQDVGVHKIGSKSSDRRFNRGENVYSNQTIRFARGDLYVNMNNINISWLYGNTRINSTNGTDAAGNLRFNRTIQTVAEADPSLNPTFEYLQNVTFSGNWIDYFGLFNLSSRYRFSNRSNETNNNITALFDRYNLGETVNGSFFLFTVRGDDLVNASQLRINFTSNQSTLRLANASTNSSGIALFNYSINQTDDSSRSGISYNVTASNNNNTVTSGPRYLVSAFLNITNIWTDKSDDGVNAPSGSEDTAFFTGADVLFVRVNVQNARAENVSGKDVYTNVTRTTGVLVLEAARNAWNSSTNAAGWNDWYSIDVVAPAGQRILNSEANDSIGNFGNLSEVITYSQSYTGNLNLELWIVKDAGKVVGQSFQQGDNITFYAQFIKDAAATDVSGNVSNLTIYFGNASVFQNVSTMTRVSAGLYNLSFAIPATTANTTYFARVYGLLSGADQYGSIWFRVSPPPVAELRSASVTGTIYQRNESIKILASCLDIDNRLTSSIANVTVFYPNNSIFINEGAMTQIETGLFNFSAMAQDTPGVYLVKARCASGALYAETLGELQIPAWANQIASINESTVNFTQLRATIDASGSLYLPDNRIIVDALFKDAAGTPISGAGCNVTLSSENLTTVLENATMFEVGVGGIPHYVFNSTNISFFNSTLPSNFSQGKFFGHVRCAVLVGITVTSAFAEVDFEVRDLGKSTPVLNSINDTRLLLQSLLARQSEFSQEEIFLVTDAFNAMTDLGGGIEAGKISVPEAKARLEFINASLQQRLGSRINSVRMAPMASPATSAAVVSSVRVDPPKRGWVETLNRISIILYVILGFMLIFLRRRRNNPV